MAKSREPVKPVESESESGEEEDDGASSEEAGSDSEHETQITKKPASSSTPATVKKTQPEVSGEEESGSESETDSDDGPDEKVRPIATKPMEDSQKSNNGARNLRSKPSASGLVTPQRKSTAAKKRPAEEKETDVKDAKKSKKKKHEPEKKSNEDSKKSLFQRLWSEDDEIVILKGMIDYVAKKKSDPVADLNDFHDSIKNNLHVDVARTQLQDKIRRMKRKYGNNKNKEKGGKERTFSNPHEQKAYELSKKIWGNENGGENGTDVMKTLSTRANTAKDVKSLKVVNGDEERLLPAEKLNSNGVSMDEWILRIGAEFFEGENGIEGEKEWKKLKLEELEVYLKELEVKSARTKLVLDVLKSADH